MPLTKFQNEVVRLLAENRSEDSYLAGGAAIHFEPETKRYSNDLDFFHDSVERVASAFAADEALLGANGFTATVEMNQPGYIRAEIRKGKNSTKIEWAHDSAWRFMPTLSHPLSGFQLHPIDLAVNKLLALVGRDEPRDFLDILEIHRTVLPLGALCWAAAGKDPGFTPHSILEILRRRGKHRPEDFSRLMLTKKVDLTDLKSTWLGALADSERFINSRPPSELGCLYYFVTEKKFVAPDEHDRRLTNGEIVPHFGRPGGVLPQAARS